MHLEEYIAKLAVGGQAIGIMTCLILWCCYRNTIEYGWECYVARLNAVTKIQIKKPPFYNRRIPTRGCTFLEPTFETLRNAGALEAGGNPVSAVLCLEAIVFSL